MGSSCYPSISIDQPQSIEFNDEGYYLPGKRNESRRRRLHHRRREPEQEEKNRNGTRKANVCCDGKANLIDFPIRHPPKNGDRPDGWDQWINTEWGTSSSDQG